ncbi:hypothetical protein EJ072_14250 [Mesorhizobium sp. M2A.F.Ca.ET.046.03.2.1]|nr:hypothetical protein [Mesorhizobium sp. M2A.F.Ca.ET.046.03.2.1]AZO35498.1 hypothetical protein EJ072_14250 [Mesorhizobium sp. M2A.F.Ca.ET.046.03.2.1]
MDCADDKTNEAPEGNGDRSEDLAQPTLNPKFTVNIRGWDSDNAEEASEFARQIGATTLDLSRHLDLSRLESVVVATDYHEAVSSFDATDQLSAQPTSNEYGQGAAMARHIIRDDEFWSVVIIWTPLVRQMANVGQEGHKSALHIFVHELVHVDDLRFFSRTYPGGWRAAKPRDGRDSQLQGIVNPCQSEYSAQRRSAWADPEHGFELLEMLGKALKDVDSQIRNARFEYRFHGNMEVLWPIVSARLTFLFQCLGYGLGHADWAIGEKAENPGLAVKYEEVLSDLAKLPSGWLLKACREAVQPFYTMKEWTGLEVYDP